MAIFADFENVAIGADQAKYAKFDIGKVMERVLVNGNVVVRKAYCDWSRYEKFKSPMHEANFELIDIPHVRQSGKNSADIRMVVDALDLCYTKPHIDAFVIISGDSDFSPLVSKLRENNKIVIGVGVKQSTSDLFVANCDDFIFYDDLVRKKAPRKSKHPAKKSAQSDAGAQKKDKAIELVVETLEAMLENKGGDDLVWGSMVKQAIKRRKPGFSESYFGFRGFNSLLEEARGAVQHMKCLPALHFLFHFIVTATRFSSFPQSFFMCSACVVLAMTRHMSALFLDAHSSSRSHFF